MINQLVSCSVRTEQKAAEAGRAMFRHSSHESASEHWAATWPRRGITSRPDTILMVSAIIDGKNDFGCLAGASWVALAARFSIPWQAVEQVDALTEKQSLVLSLVVLLPAARSADAERPRRESRGRHSIFRSSEKYHVDLGIPKYISVICYMYKVNDSTVDLPVGTNFNWFCRAGEGNRQEQGG